MQISRTGPPRPFEPRATHSPEELLSSHWGQAASAVLAGTFVSLGLRRRSFGGTVVALTSGALLYQGLHSRRRATPGGARTARGPPSSEQAGRTPTTHVERTITVGRPAEVLYRLWRDPQTLGRLMAPFADVKPTGGSGQHWKLHGPLGRTLEWDSRVVEERTPEFIRWESIGGGALAGQGWVRLRPAPANWGTEVTLHLAFSPPGRALAGALAKRLHGLPALPLMKVLRRFKSLAETGEMPTLQHNPSARASAD
ncbi:MAG: SRPBCC family protein [Myxococcaceae bacterium]|nr:MAG: SRPBCC family protein [Myxococcaceae bacterium]